MKLIFCLIGISTFIFGHLQAKNLHLFEPQYYEFKNGFKLIMIENHATPMIASVIIVGCGSKDESPEINGAAHLLEHLLFNGTTTRSQEELYDAFDDYGLYINAQTSQDYTSFISVAQKQFFNKAIEITVDMLFNSILPPDKLEKERRIVVEEIVKNLNDEEAQMRAQFFSWFYEGTPYSKPVIGNKQTVIQMSREDIYNFYKKHYVADQMQALIIGDFKCEDMIKLFENTISRYPKSDPAPNNTFSENIFTQKFEQTKEYRIKSGAYTFFALPAPLIDNKYSAAFDLWMEYYFGAGDRLETLINQSQKLISDLAASYEYHKPYAHLIVSARLDSNSTAQIFKNRFRETLEQEANTLQNHQALENICTKRLVDEILLTEKLHYFGVMKSQLLSIGGVETFLNILETLPKIQTSDIVAINKILWSSNIYQEFNSREPVKRVPKSQSPIAGAQEGDSVSAGKTIFFNGLTGYIVSDKAAPILAIHILVKGRNIIEPGDKKGMADLAHRLLLTGTKRSPGAALQEELNKIGATVKVTDSPFIPYDNYYNQPDYSYIRLTTLDRFAERGIGVLSEMLYEPEWTEEELAKVKQEQLLAITKSANQPGEIARRALYASLYSDSAMGQHPQGLAEDVVGVTLAELQSFAKYYFQPNNLIITAISSLPTEEIEILLKKYFKAQDFNEESPWPFVTPSLRPLDESLSTSQVSPTEQGYIYIGIPFSVDPEDRAALQILSLILSEKISFNLREKQGLAYSIGSTIEFLGNQAVILINMGTQKKNLAQSMAELKKEINAINHWTLDQKIIAKNVNAYRGRIYMRWIAREVRAYYAGIDLFQHNHPNFSNDLLNSMSRLSSKEVAEVAKKYLTEPKILTVVVN